MVRADKISGRHYCPVIPIYDASIPPLIHMLGGLSSASCAKGEAHGGIDPNEARLAPDMLPLKNQVYIATDGAKGCGADGWPGSRFPNLKSTEVHLRRSSKSAPTRPSLSSKAWTPNPSPARRPKQIVLKFLHHPNSNGADYVGRHFVLPNVYFHITTAYALHFAQPGRGAGQGPIIWAAPV